MNWLNVIVLLWQALDYLCYDSIKIHNRISCFKSVFDVTVTVEVCLFCFVFSKKVARLRVISIPIEVIKATRMLRIIIHDRLTPLQTKHDVRALT